MNSQALESCQERRNAFRDADHKRDFGIDRFHDCVRGKGRRNEDDGSGRARFLYCLRNGVENRQVEVLGSRPFQESRRRLPLCRTQQPVARGTFLLSR